MKKSKKKKLQKALIGALQEESDNQKRLLIPLSHSAEDALKAVKTNLGIGKKPKNGGKRGK